MYKELSVKKLIKKENDVSTWNMRTEMSSIHTVHVSHTILDYTGQITIFPYLNMPSWLSKMNGDVLKFKFKSVGG